MFLEVLLQCIIVFTLAAARVVDLILTELNLAFYILNHQITKLKNFAKFSQYAVTCFCLGQLSKVLVLPFLPVGFLPLPCHFA